MDLVQGHEQEEIHQRHILTIVLFKGETVTLYSTSKFGYFFPSWSSCLWAPTIYGNQINKRCTFWPSRILKHCKFHDRETNVEY